MKCDQKYCRSCCSGNVIKCKSFGCESVCCTIKCVDAFADCSNCGCGLLCSMPERSCLIKHYCVKLIDELDIMETDEESSASESDEEI
ncbi:hypothetical protein HK099_007726 [Clydaea vesicula]|uniref:Uncharacterized protein n=1 Tax=Clydaea vesicula TaxID=447962 RepID=A0AAD5XXC2_9FUNG|nr:hypothetical protein HK099_007726 [Clydaea vesicula]